MGLLDELIDKLRTAVTGKRSRRTDARTDVRPASEDPLGDPADLEPRGSSNVRPASEDPLGDPADQGQFGNVRPASEDPLGDPADEEDRRSRRR